MPARVFVALVCTTTLLISINIAAVWGDNHNIGTYKTTNRGGGLACLLEKDLDEAVDALMAGGEGDNYDWLQSILDSGRCIMMKKGLKVRIKDFGFLTSEIYLFPPGGSRPVAVFTANKNFTSAR